MKIPPFQIENYIQKIAGENIAGCLVFGPEESLVHYRFDLIAKKISPNLSDPFLVTQLSKERLGEDKGILADEFFSYPMLGGKKLILVKDAEAAASIALKVVFEGNNFASKTISQNENFILIQAGDLDKNSALRKLAENNSRFAAIACYEDNELTVKKFIANQLTLAQVNASPQTIDYLLEKIGKNRQIILAELEKIFLFLDEKKNLTIEIIERLTTSTYELSANEMVMNFASQKFTLSAKQSEALLRDGFEAISLIRFLNNYFQKLYQAKIDIESGLTDFESAIKSQRLFFKVEIEFRKHLKSLSLNFLVKILQDLEKLEVKSKSGIWPSKLLFTAFMTNFI